MRVATILATAIACSTVAARSMADDLVQQLFELHNKERQANGVAPFECLDSQLSQLSADHVKYEVSIDNINHDGFSGRCQKVGNVACGENTLYDFKGDAAKFTQSWMNSPGHRKNILNGAYKHVGFAVEKGPSGKWFATSMFTDSNPRSDVCGGSKPGPVAPTDAPYTRKPSGPTGPPITTTAKPTVKPTKRPLPTGPPISPTTKPTKRPTPKTPTPIPYTKRPTKRPTTAPTNEPSDEPSDDPSYDPTDAPSNDDVVKQLFKFHNEERQKNGLKPFSCLNSKLSSLSMDHVNYEISIGDINHDGFSDRCQKAGNYGGCGENTLYDYEGDARVMTTSWMNSAGHRANILNGEYNHVGFAVKKGGDNRYYATAMFTQDSRACQ